MRKILSEYRGVNFDVCVLLSVMQVCERYITDSLLSRNCLKICYFTNTSPLLNNYQNLEIINSDTKYIGNLISKIKNTNTLSEFLKMIKHYISLIVVRSKHKIRILIDRYVFPLLVAGRIFPLQKLDWATQLGTNQMDGIFLLDPAEIELYKQIYPDKEIRQVKNPNSGSCRCKEKIHNKNALLSPLSGLMGSNELPSEYKNIFIRDARTALSQTNTSEIHLRLHPRESGIWPKLLCDALLAEGIFAKLVNSESSLKEIVCDYKGVIGFASGAIRDARASCNRASVILFPDLPKKIYDNQIACMGNAEGIGRINNDGTYNSNIFKGKKFEEVSKKSLVEQLIDILKIKKDSYD